MRGSSEVMNQIMKMANGDVDIRAVMMNGSRINPNVTPDIMQDYDVVFFLRNFDNLSYKKNQEWITQFGEMVIYQQNDFEDGSYIFLMQFEDGVRIDLRFCDIHTVNQVVQEDTLSMLLVDKDNCVSELPSPSDCGHWVKKPDVEEWDRLLNELWWIQTYVAKGLWREELPYAKYMYDVILINSIRKLLSWYIGEKTGWRTNVGKCGKFLEELLDTQIYQRFIGLYTNGDYETIWACLFDAGTLIREIGVELSDKLSYKYPSKYDKNVTEYIKRIKGTPKDA